MEELHGSRGITRRAFVALGTAAAASLVLGRETAFAATSWGKTGTKTLSGITYTYRAGIDPGPAHKAHAYVSAKPKVGASQLAAKALIYDASGMLLASGGWKYGDGSSAYATIPETFLGGAQGGRLFLKKAGGSNSYTMSRAKTSRSGERFRVGESGGYLRVPRGRDGRDVPRLLERPRGDPECPIFRELEQRPPICPAH